MFAAVNSALPEIEEFHKGPRLRTGMPWLTLGWRDTTFNPASEQGQHQLASIDLVLETNSYDSELSQDMAMDYMTVLDAIIRSAGPFPSYADWTKQLPIVHESVLNGNPLTTSLNSGGSGYQANDTVTGHTASDLHVTINTVDGTGKVLTYTVTAVGTGIFADEAVELLDGGNGAGFSLNIVTVSPVTIPLPVGSVKNVFITRESLEQVVRQGTNIPVLAVSMEITVEFEERMDSGA